jgi:hypothetical protein
MNRKGKHAALAAGALLVVTAIALAAGSQWILMPSPNATNANYLYATAAISPSDIWAVGYDYSTSNVQQTLTENWNGRKWSIIPGPNPGTQSNCGVGYDGSALTGVAAASATDLWAVGYICGYNSRTFAAQWNGAKWATVSTPNEPDATTSTLVAVAAVATDDVWAVGNYQAGGSQYQWNTLIEHWDGAQWSIVESPNVAGADKNYLMAVTAVSSSDIWAVGYSETNITDVPLIEHYDGVAWSIVSSPYPSPSEFNGLYALAAVSSDDVWAVGYENENSQGQYGGALMEHWDGIQWSLVNAPVLGFATTMYGLSAVSSTDIWAVGYIWKVGTSYTPVTEHWNGTRWSAQDTPDPSKAAELFGIATNSGRLWAVGAYSASGGAFLKDPRTLILAR